MLAVLCLAVVIIAICGGIAYTSIQQARFQVARAGIGQVEAVLLLAEKTAEENGMGSPPATFQSLLKSYDSRETISLPAYEKYLLNTMLQILGPQRDFDFAVSRYEDGAGVHTDIYFFPAAGYTDLQRDRYFLLHDGVISAVNS